MSSLQQLRFHGAFRLPVSVPAAINGEVNSVAEHCDGVTRLSKGPPDTPVILPRWACLLTPAQTRRQTDRQANRQTDRQADRQTHSRTP
ncbi:putative glycosyltransferase [Portunus trituberculatus]|uniref:Putative glycosyltransferase n=1 Tax=Portunus trituberculatus TaxID=210409 RepID=A0A5B7HUX4_PORTR|nr:putative glycosyltransferase [Portunus trituberculatus]